MSSLRNAVKRITHKERSQPRNRKHLGILEKKKDYKQRAIDYHKKQDRIKALREKASFRNPDEFYFGMHNAQVKDGQHKSLKQYDNVRNFPPEVIQLMKDQDLAYVRMQKQKDIKKAERMQASLHLLGDQDDNDGTGNDLSSKFNKKRKHTIFVSSVQEAENFDVAKHFDTLPELASRSFNRLRTKDVERLAKSKLKSLSTNGNDEDDDDDEDGDESNIPSTSLTAAQLQEQIKAEKKLAKKLAKARSSAYAELEARIKRAKTMQRVENHLITEKLVASKGRKRKIKAAENGKPAQYIWRRKRLG